MTSTVASVAPPARDPGATPSAEGIPLREYPNWDPVRQVWVWQCGPAGLTIDDVLDDECPDEASFHRWLKAYPVPTALIGLEQQFIDEDDEAAG